MPQSPPSTETTTAPAPSGGPAEPSIDELLRILEASSQMRRERDLVAEQLNLDQVKAGLRDRILDAARASGDPVRPEEVDAAIEQYYARLYDFREPPFGPEIALAHLYVRRVSISAALAAGLLALLLAWMLFLRPMAPLSPSGRTARSVASSSTAIDRLSAELGAIARDPEATDRIDRLRDEALALADARDPAGLERVRVQLERLGETLRAEYDVEVVREPGRKSGIDTYYNDDQGRRVAGYYLIVEARPPGGRPIPRRIRNEETGQTATVSSWAERVPKAVYDRVADDKRADGRIDDYLFAVKRAGLVREQVRMVGDDGRPIPRTGQITEW